MASLPQPMRRRRGGATVGRSGADGALRAGGPLLRAAESPLAIRARTLAPPCAIIRANGRVQALPRLRRDGPRAGAQVPLLRLSLRGPPADADPARLAAAAPLRHAPAGAPRRLGDRSRGGGGHRLLRLLPARR